jgi:AcrR family transcriptional regulator
MGTKAAARPRSRGRPPVISTERLLEVAREVFLELGIRATTAEVASRAGIAEGTIFHRFKSKEELFRAAMNFDPDTALVLVESLLVQGGSGDLRETLVEFAARFIEFGRVAVPVMMMSWSNPESQLCAERTSERTSRYHRVLAALGAVFAAEMAKGRLREAQPEVMSRMLIGSLHHFCMTELFMGEPKSGFTHRDFAEQVVDVLLASREGTR